jgi:hypothetical protein
MTRVPMRVLYRLADRPKQLEADFERARASRAIGRQGLALDEFHDDVGCSIRSDVRAGDTLIQHRETLRILPQMMAWACDEQGQPASPKGPANWSPTDCAQQKFGVTGGLPDPASSLEVPPFPDPLPLAQKVSTMTADLCNHHVYVTAQLMLGNIQGTSVVTQIFMYLGEKPLMVRDYLAGQQYLQGIIDAKSQQQMKNAQQQKAPSL